MKRKKIVHNFNTAKRAGIVFDASKPEGFQHVTKFRKYLSSRKISSVIIGYVDADDISGELILWENCHFFCRKDLDLLYRPKKPQVLSFIHENTDILFDLCLTTHFPLQYISALTPSSFKVGKYSDSPNDLDLMINIKENQDIEYFIDQIIHYVNLLNNPAELSLKQN